MTLKEKALETGVEETPVLIGPMVADEVLLTVLAEEPLEEGWEDTPVPVGLTTAEAVLLYPVDSVTGAE